MSALLNYDIDSDACLVTIIVKSLPETKLYIYQYILYAIIDIYMKNKSKCEYIDTTTTEVLQVYLTIAVG